MNTYRLFPEERQQAAIDNALDTLPDHVELAQLSFTGSRAFGWGDEQSDIDLRGFIVGEDWFNKCHGNFGTNFDMTLKNIRSMSEPDIPYQRWKVYYDNSNPIYIHDDFDYEDFISTVSTQHIHHVYPYDLKVQMGRMDSRFSARNCLHTYKELMIPLHFIHNNHIETNIVAINEFPQFQLEGVDICVKHYDTMGGGVGELPEDLIRREINELFDELGEEIPEREAYIQKTVRS